MAERVVNEDFVLTASVMMEVEWVLRSRYRFTVAQRASALRMLLELPGAVAVPRLANWVIERMEAGADLADMIHLTLAESATCFATFDAGIAADAGRDSPLSIETLA